MVKICGITRLEDARGGGRELGAAALGFVFWPDSPRFIDPSGRAAIAAALPPFVTPVGVFVNQPVDYVDGVASLVRPRRGAAARRRDAVRLRRVARPVIKAMPVATASTSRRCGRGRTR